MAGWHDVRLLTSSATKLTIAGAHRVIVREHRERATGGAWLSAVVLWRGEHHRFDTAQMAYESWTENIVAMVSRLAVLAARLSAKAAHS